MNFSVIILRGFGYGWTTLTIVVFLVRFLIIGPEGFSWIFAVIILLPGIGAIFLANRLSEILATELARARGLMTSKKAAELVRHYGRTRLIDDVLPPDGLADEEELPESKERIKQALLMCLAEEEDEQTREQLKEGYLSLANYQAGVDQENTEFGVTRLASPSEFVRQADIYEKWRPIVEQEHAELISDLKKVGYWGDEAQLKSATCIEWTPDPLVDSADINVVAPIRQSPGKKNVKFAPTSCGALILNDGAAVSALDPATGEPLLPPMVESDPLILVAVEDMNSDGVITRDGRGDEDGDGITDLDEVSGPVVTDPCNPDTDGDGSKRRQRS